MKAAKVAPHVEVEGAPPPMEASFLLVRTVPEAAFPPSTLVRVLMIGGTGSGKGVQKKSK